ncbi:MAG: hypothetical protein Q8M07_11980 [Prosthecobacter sp.]|nr:hypothetical protein [Prosthecobacter sp.]
MPETDLVLLFTRPLERAGLRYFITGSIAGMNDLWRGFNAWRSF